MLHGSGTHADAVVTDLAAKPAKYLKTKVFIVPQEAHLSKLEYKSPVHHAEERHP